MPRSVLRRPFAVIPDGCRALSVPRCFLEIVVVRAGDEHYG
jgi:hypothetical protein